MKRKTGTHKIPCSGCGAEIVRSVNTLVASAKCEACRRASISKSRRVWSQETDKGRWGTAAEVKLINGMSRETARKYLEGPQGLEDRENWDGIDKKKCIEACRERDGI